MWHGPTAQLQCTEDEISCCGTCPNQQGTCDKTLEQEGATNGSGGGDHGKPEETRVSTSSPLPHQDTAMPHLRSRRAPGGSAGTRAGAGCPPGAAASGCWRSGPSYENRLPRPSPQPGTPCCRGSTGAGPHSTTAEPGRPGPGQAEPSRAWLRPVRFNLAQL